MRREYLHGKSDRFLLSLKVASPILVYLLNPFSALASLGRHWHKSQNWLYARMSSLSLGTFEFWKAGLVRQVYTYLGR